eukprot:GILJ01013030.1.p1 GENE.GILJ01013030.1~~GILJ01013030.1.p1  ORF type:complete len:564 (-),score=86.56 GILJ01013030.1:207-1850(-)
MEGYEVLGHIGTGSFGTVSRIKRKSDGKVMVWKELNYGSMSEKEKQQLVAEVNILRELRHPHIVRYHDRFIDKARSKIYIVMEHCEGGDLATLIKKCKREREYVPEDTIWKIFTQVVLALHECHRRADGKIFHRDLKPGNVFLDGQQNVKLGDFGLARVMSKESQFAYTHVGTPYYMSPEQINESKYNEKSDIWSAGCLLYELAALSPPFEASNHLALAIKIRGGRFDRVPSRFSEELQRVIKWMLSSDPTQRPSVDDLLNVPQVSLRVREKRMKENYAALKKKEEDLKARELSLDALEATLRKREEEVRRKETESNQGRVGSDGVVCPSRSQSPSIERETVVPVEKPLVLPLMDSEASQTVFSLDTPRGVFTAVPDVEPSKESVDSPANSDGASDGTRKSPVGSELDSKLERQMPPSGSNAPAKYRELLRPIQNILSRDRDADVMQSYTAKLVRNIIYKRSNTTAGDEALNGTKEKENTTTSSSSLVPPISGTAKAIETVRVRDAARRHSFDDKGLTSHRPLTAGLNSQEGLTRLTNALKQNRFRS